MTATHSRSSRFVGGSVPSEVALRVYLALIAGHEPAASYLEIRAKRLTGGMDQEFVPIAQSDRAARILVNRGQVTDTYIGVAPRARRAGGLDAIERVWCVWADLDSPDAPHRVETFAPQPSLVIASGTDGHAHAYWALRSAITGEWAKRANVRLALRLGADRAATDAARIMRPPATRNYKASPARPVVCTHLEPIVYDLRDVVGGLPDPPAPVPRPPAAAVPAGGTADGLVRTVREAQPGTRNARLYWAACRARDERVDAYEQLRTAALDAGLPEHEVDRTLASAFDARSAAA